MKRSMNHWALPVITLAAGIVFLNPAAKAAFVTGDGNFGAGANGANLGLPWTAVGHTSSGTTPTYSTSAQSPFTNVFASNGQGAQSGATDVDSSAYGYFVQTFSSYSAAATNVLYLNVDFQNTSTPASPSYYTITMDANGNGGPNRLGALVIGTNSVYADGFQASGTSGHSVAGGGLTLVSAITQNTWYNAQLTIDLGANNYSVALTPFGGATTTVSNIPFVQTSSVFGAIFSDGNDSSTNLGSGNVPAHNIDNFALSDTPLPEPTTLSLLATGGCGVLARRRRWVNSTK